MGASASGAGQDADEEARRRLDAYTYLSAPEGLEHLAIMRVFCGTLLADLAVPNIMAKPGRPATGRHPAGVAVTALGRGELAAMATGSAHGLDDGT